MTVFIAKAISRFSTTSAFPEREFLLLVDSFRALALRLAPRPEWLSAIFIALAIFAAGLYIIEINVIVLEGRKIPALEATLRELEHEQKQRLSQLAALRSPLVLKKEAVRGNKMVEVGSISYVRDSQEVASTLSTSP